MSIGRPPYHTPNFDLPVPGGEEDADGVTAFRELADRLDDVLKEIADQGGGGNGGGDAGALELIAEQIVTENTQSVTFADIPQTFRHLRLLARTRSTGETEGNIEVNSNLFLLSMRFNGVGTGSYHVNWLRNVQPDQAGSRGVFGSQWAHVGMVGPRASTVVDIIDYTTPGVRYSSQSGMFNGTGTTYSMLVAGEAADAVGAVSSIQVSTLGSWPQEFMLPGSRLTLYGVK